jgi:REP element-mobilizing transposase RayT
MKKLRTNYRLAPFTPALAYARQAPAASRRCGPKARSTVHIVENSASSRALPIVAFYRRRFPHLQPDGKPLFITWHLFGSLPHHRFPPPHSLSAGKAFVWMDRQLDSAVSGPTWLLREEVARMVADALHYSAETLLHYDLHAFVIMANHVHVLLTPHVDPVKLLHSVKSFTARQANKILGRVGEPFRQAESYDHFVRNTVELDRIRRYIEENPVRAGLVLSPEDYRWSSAHAVVTT